MDFRIKILKQMLPFTVVPKLSSFGIASVCLKLIFHFASSVSFFLTEVSIFGVLTNSDGFRVEILKLNIFGSFCSQ